MEIVGLTAEEVPRNVPRLAGEGKQGMIRNVTVQGLRIAAKEIVRLEKGRFKIRHATDVTFIP